MTTSTRTRDLWALVEGVRSPVYFAPDGLAAYEALGLKVGWMGDFATRSAPLGAATPGEVTAMVFPSPTGVPRA